MGRLLRSPGFGIAFCALLGILLPAIHGLAVGIPRPISHDEYSYLLAADTFARGRLTNPAPRSPEFFEAEHVLVEPTYQSKYPPGQGLILATGQLLTGHPIWGVWLGCGLFAGSLCWMLQAWISRRWAILLTTLVCASLGTATYWAQSYWGGMLAASGAAIVLGATRRLVKAPAVSTSAIMGAGLLLLATTRPLEGALASIPTIVLLVHSCLAGPVRWARLSRAVLPAVAVLAAGGFWTATYNRAVTGSALEMPHALHLRQYFHQGLFLFSPHRTPLRTPVVERVARFYEESARPPLHGRELIAEGAGNFVVRLALAGATTFGLTFIPADFSPYRGLSIWLLLVPLALGRRSVAVLLGTVVVAMALEIAAWRADADYLILLAPAMALGGLLNLKFFFNSGRWSRLALVSVAATMSVEAVVWWWFPHYSAPLLPIYVAVVGMAMRRVTRLRGSSLNVGFMQLLAVVLVAQVAALAVNVFLRPAPAERDLALLASREAVIGGLAARNGPDLVFVSYDPDHSTHFEWVYNSHDLPGAPVVFAHDLGDEHNITLIEQYPGRAIWRLHVSQMGGLLEPYGEMKAPVNHRRP